MDGSALSDEFRAYLRNHNLPVTPQRLAVAAAVSSHERHVSADEISRALDARGMAVGTATVYRTLEILVRSGLVMERDFGEGFKRYESARGTPHHEHLLCTICGAVVEFEDDRLDRMSTLLAESHGFTRSSHRLVIYGMCAACRGKS